MASTRDTFDAGYSRESASLFYARQAIADAAAKDDFGNESKRSYQYKSQETKSIDPTQKDQEFQNVRLRRVVLDKCRTTVQKIRTILKKRLLNKKEKEIKNNLELKERSTGLTTAEKDELVGLTETQLNPSDAPIIAIYKKQELISYYLKAGDILKPGKKNVSQWDGSTPHNSQEDISRYRRVKEEDKRAKIFVKNSKYYISEMKDIENKCKSGLPCVILPYHRFMVGGEVETGGVGFAEELHRTSTIEVAMTEEIQEHFFPIQDDAVFYMPGLVLMFNGEEHKYQGMKQHDKFERVVAYSPLIIHGRNAEDMEGEMTEEQFRIEKLKIRNAFATALFYGHNYVLCGNFGCSNQFKLPASTMARAVKEVIFDPADEFYYRFRRIVIMIDDTDGAKERRFNIFRNELHGVTHAV
jgi:hypothetical protein